MRPSLCGLFASFRIASGRHNLLTSPRRDDVKRPSYEELLQESTRSCVLLGKEYASIDGQRQGRDSIKTVTKIHLAFQGERFTIRPFAALVSLICFALHTTQLKPADVFPLIRCYRVLYRQVARGQSWGTELQYHQQLCSKRTRRVRDVTCGETVLEHCATPSERPTRIQTTVSRSSQMRRLQDGEPLSVGEMVRFVLFQSHWTHDLNMHGGHVQQRHSNAVQSSLLAHRRTTRALCVFSTPLQLFPAFSFAECHGDGPLPNCMGSERRKRISRYRSWSVPAPPLRIDQRPVL
jgi:hypothetical protein